MRTLLVNLGYQVPERDYSYQASRPKSDLMLVDEQVHHRDRHDSSATLGKSCEIHLVWSS